MRSNHERGGRVELGQNPCQARWSTDEEWGLISSRHTVEPPHPLLPTSQPTEALTHAVHCEMEDSALLLPYISYTTEGILKAGRMMVPAASTYLPPQSRKVVHYQHVASLTITTKYLITLHRKSKQKPHLNLIQ